MPRHPSASVLSLILAVVVAGLVLLPTLATLIKIEHYRWDKD